MMNLRFRRSASAPPFGGAYPSFGRLLVPVLGRGGGLERVNQPPGDRRDVLDRGVERRLVGAGRSVEAAQLAHELQRGGADFFVGGRGIEVEEGADITAHGQRSFAVPFA